MKYFSIDENGKYPIGNATSAKAFLRDNPSTEKLFRWWWSGNDLIDCEEFSREQILRSTSHKLNRGATAQWAVNHNDL